MPHSHALMAAEIASLREHVRELTGRLATANATVENWQRKCAAQQASTEKAERKLARISAAAGVQPDELRGLNVTNRYRMELIGKILTE